MEVSWAILVVLLRGVVALKFHDAITGAGRRQFKEMLVTSTLYVLVVYSIAFAISLIPHAPLTMIAGEAGISGWTIPAVFAIALVVGWLAALADEHRWAVNVAKWLGKSKRGWRGAWLDAFLIHGRRKWVCVYLQDGTRILGWVRYGSSPTEEQALFVARGGAGDAPVRVWPPGDPAPFPIDGPGVLLPPSSRISLVALLEGAEEA